MRKTLLMAFGLILAALLSTSAISPAQAYIEEWTWLPPFVIRGYDSMFYYEYIVGYEVGSTASLNVLVENDLWPYDVIMNVSAVKIGFDWNINYSSNEASVTNPVQLSPWETHTFKISFTVPSTTVASNMWTHTYTVYVEWVNATGGPVGSWARDWYTYKFAVYSADQVNAVDLLSEYQALRSSYPPYYFSNTNASLLATQAGPQASMGEVLYERGDFAGARTKIQTALDLYNLAFAIEGDWGTTYQEAELNVIQMEAEAYSMEAEAAMLTANAVMIQSYALLLFGGAAMLFGAAAVIYAIRKPKL